MGRAVAAEDLAIGNYTVLSQNRVERTVWEYVLGAQVHNGGEAAALNVRGRLTGVGAGASIVEGNLSFGDVAAGATVGSVDTFTIRQDRTVAFEAAGLVWQIEAGAVEPPVELAVTITEPGEGFLTRAMAVEVAGTMGAGVTRVSVNGVEATLEGETFRATVEVIEGPNVLTAIARDEGTGEGRDSVRIRVDRTAPLLNVEQPAEGAVVEESTVNVVGMINDLVAGTVNAGDCEVEVNGVEARIANRSYEAAGVLLVRGENVLRVVARDAAGNESRREVRVVYREGAEQQRVRVVAGNNQGGRIGTILADPLVVEVVDGIGNPVEGVGVRFRVVRNDGVLIREPERGRELVVRSDENGLAAVQFQLGTRTGVGNNQVMAGAVGFGEEVLFCSSAEGGPAVRVAPLTPETQVGAVGEALPLPWTVYAVDAGGNPVAGAEVAFLVMAGGGNLEGEGMVRRVTDANGRAAVVQTLGPELAINGQVVRALLVGSEGEEGATSFTATAKVSADPLDTRVSGLVLDHANRPMSNIHCAILGTSLETVTDAEGQFVLHGVPVGHVVLDVDARDRGYAGEWHNLHFDLVTVAGQDNQVDRPIYMLPLDGENAQVAGGAETVVLAMKEIPGATLTIHPHSVRGPNGEREMRVLWTQVNMERVPMPPPLGSQFMLAWTVQPAGVIFDPPASICIPNMGAPAGQQVEIFSFDHDLMEFVAVGTATVTADGAVMCSDPGFGVMKAGWGGCVPPPPPCTPVCGPAPTPPECMKLVTTPPAGPCDCPTYSFEPLDGTACDDGDDCTYDDQCNGGTCEGKPKKIVMVEGKVEGQDEWVTCPEREIAFSVSVDQEGCETLKYEWDFGDGNTSMAESPTHKYENTGSFTVTVTVTCEECPSLSQNDTVQVDVVEITDVQVRRHDEPDAVFQNDPKGFCKDDQINGRATLNPSKGPSDGSIRWEIRLVGFFSDTVKASGSGTNFVNQVLDEEGTYQVVFYCDANENSVFDSGFFSEEANAETQEFEVEEIEDFNLSVNRHIDIAYTDAQVDGNLSPGSALLRKKDRILGTGGDERCCVNYQRSGATGTFGTAGDGLDVITTNAQLNQAFAAAGDIKVVTSMTGVCNATGVVLGCGRSGGSLIITTGAAADVWIHEWGHVRGLSHNDADPAYIMHSTAPNTDSVTEAECEAFKP
jgi:PKD repeat protein